MKMDYGAIDNFAGFGGDMDDPDEDTEGNKMILRSTRPPHAPESNILRKRRRYIAWSQELEKIDEDMTSYHNAVQYVHKELRTLERQEGRWLDSFEFARNYLTGCLQSCRVENAKMSSDSDVLKYLCLEEIGRLESRKKKNTFSRDVLVEMNNRQDTIDRLLERYEDLLEDISPGVSNDSMPVTHIEIDENTGRKFDESAAMGQGGASMPNMPAAQALAVDENKGGGMPRRSLRSSVDTAPEKIEKVHVDPAVKIEDMLRPFDDVNILDTKYCPEIDAFYHAEESDWLLDKRTSLTEDEKKWHAIPDMAIERLISEPYFNLGQPSQPSWYKLIENLCAGASLSDSLAKTLMKDATSPNASTSGPNHNRPKRSIMTSSSETIQLKSFATARAPRGVPLIVSPLSQYPDRFVGAVLGVGRNLDDPTTIETIPSSGSSSNSSSTSVYPFRSESCMDVNAMEYKIDELSISPHLLQSENKEMQKCQLISALTAGRHKLNKLRASNTEWANIVEQSNKALDKAKNLCANALKGQFVESRIHRKELVHYGLASADNDDEPLSPLVYPEYFGQGDAGNNKTKKIVGKRNFTRILNNLGAVNNGAHSISTNSNNEEAASVLGSAEGDAVSSSPSKSDVNAAGDEPKKRISRSQAAATSQGKDKSPEIIKREQQLEALSALKNKITIEEEDKKQPEVKAAATEKKIFSKKKKR